MRTLLLDLGLPQPQYDLIWRTLRSPIPRFWVDQNLCGDHCSTLHIGEANAPSNYESVLMSEGVTCVISLPVLKILKSQKT